MSILENAIRWGNFTSSNAYKLMSLDKSKKGFGKPALTYIEECNMERELGASIHTESDARPLQWGKVCERVLFDQLPPSYTLTSDVTIQHPDYDFWVGSPDGYTDDTLAEFKCPMTKKSWFKLAVGENIFSMIDGFSLNGAQYSEHSDGEKFYWQCISNAILLKKKYAELGIFIPYRKDLLAIVEEARAYEYRWIINSSGDDIPFIDEGGKFKSITKHRFEVPQKDIDLLTEKMVEGSKLLIPRNNAFTH